MEPGPGAGSSEGAAPEPGASARSARPRYRIGMDPESDASHAESARNLTAGLGGTAVALLTFTLFFLWPQYKGGNVNGTLFELTVAVIVLSVFFFAYSSVYYGRLVGVMLVAGENWRYVSAVAGLFQLLGLAFLALQPSLVLFTIGLDPIAGLALALWGGFLLTVALGRRDFYPWM